MLQQRRIQSCTAQISPAQVAMLQTGLAQIGMRQQRRLQGATARLRASGSGWHRCRFRPCPATLEIRFPEIGTRKSAAPS